LIRSPHFWNKLGEMARLAWRNDRAAQLVEFAVALPLLVLFVVGIFDFSNAFTLKQKFTNIARDAARVAAADPANDLYSPLSTAPLPLSVMDAFQDIDSYLFLNRINDCGIVATGSPVGMTWTFTGTGNGCPPPGLTVVINRGYYFSAAAASQPAVDCSTPQLAGTQTLIIGTCVSIQYVYQWRFGGVANILGANTVLPTTITAAAIAMNEN
jgi:Flp pilus assembly protein TadG